jgi:glutamyl-tRNA reductase
LFIIVTGLNHKTAPVEVREKVAVAKYRLQDHLHYLMEKQGVSGAVILSTCNRTEVYLSTGEIELARGVLQEYYGKIANMTVAEILPFLYTYEEEKAVHHLFRVSAGLDSMILGESQILGQVQEAFQEALKAGTTNNYLNNLWQKAIIVGKRARTETFIDRQAVSVSSAAVELAKEIFGDLEGRTVLVLGAGETSELTARHLVANGISSVIVANRTFARAQALAQEFGGLAVKMDQFHDYLKEADIVISCTAAPNYIVHPADIERIQDQRQNKPLFLIDIAVPRDIDPLCASYPNVTLYDVDDLENVVQKNINERLKEAEKVENIIKEEKENFFKWVCSLKVVPTIVALKEKAEGLKKKELDRAFRRLGNLSEKDKKVISSCVSSVVNQLLHDAILQLKDVSYSTQGLFYAEVINKLFNLQIEEASEKARVESH